MVTSLPMVGLNPYAIGMRLLEYVEDLEEKGRISYEFEKLCKIDDRKNYDQKSEKI